MKKILFSSILLVIMSLSAWAAPKIVFDKTTHNFGKIRPDTTHSISFIFHNRGTSTLVIERVRAGWGCTGTLLSEREIPAGGSGVIEVEFFADRYLGQSTKSILIITNDPANRSIRIILEAEVTDDIKE